jgi:hypothetical protein
MTNATLWKMAGVVLLVAAACAGAGAGEAFARDGLATAPATDRTTTITAAPAGAGGPSSTAIQGATAPSAWHAHHRARRARVTAG